MLLLGDYLGQLLAAITNARLQADLESARIAQLYAGHPLLRHMPVPRFRMPDVTLDLPLAIEAAQSPPQILKVDAAVLRAGFEAIAEEELGTRRIEMTSAGRSVLAANLGAVFETLQGAAGVSAETLGQLAERAAAAASTVVKATSSSAPDDLVASYRGALVQRFADQVARLLPLTPRVQVGVITGQLKEVAPPQYLTRIHLSISEEGVEWAQTKPDDASSKTLLPE